MSRLSIGYKYIISHGYLPVEWLAFNDFKKLVTVLRKEGYHVELDRYGYNIVINGKLGDYEEQERRFKNGTSTASY